MTRSEIAPLTGLRALAALGVVAYHLRTRLDELFPSISHHVFHDGYLGVDIFFVLSGFIMALNYAGRLRTRGDYFAFLGYRIARIYPLHLVTLLGVLVLASVAQLLDLPLKHAERYQIDYHLPLHLLLMHSWGFEESLRFNVPSWSISAEFFAYLLFPLFWGVASRVRSAWLAGLAAGALSLGTVAVLRLGLGYADLHVVTQHTLVRVSGEFLAGCLVYRAFAERAQRPAGPAAWYVALVAGSAAIWISPWADWLMPTAACALVYALARGRGPAVAAFALAPVEWLGRVSYSVYLLHLPTLSVLRRVLLRRDLAEAFPGAPFLLLAVALATIAAVAAAGYYGIELPARRALRRWVRGHVPDVGWERRDAQVAPPEFR